MHAKRLMPAIATIGAIALLAGCAGGGGGAEAANEKDGQAGAFDWASVEPVEITVSNIFAPGATSTNLVEDWMDQVTELTEGAVTFDYYEGGVLHPANEAISALTSDLTDVTFVNSGSFPDQLPIQNWKDIAIQTATSGFGYPNTNIAGIGQQVIQYGEENFALDEARAVGFVPLIPMYSGPAGLHCTESFETKADLEGRTARVPNAISQGENEALGMTTVFLPPNEQYEALQRGVVDCAVNAATTILSADLLAVSPWVAFTNNAASSGANWVISTSTWDSLIPEVQDAMIEASYEPLLRFTRDTLDSYKDIVSAAEAAGGGVVDAAELNPHLAEYWEGRPSLLDSAPSGLADPEAALEFTNTVAETWWDFSIEELGVPVDNDNIVEVLELGSGVLSDSEWDAWLQAVRDKLGQQ